MAFRVDSGTLRPAKFLPDGRVRVDAYLTRTGVFVYQDAAGKEFREYRPDSEVFSPASMETFALAVVTDNHPPTPITAENRAQYERGTVLESVKRDGIHMVASLLISDPVLVEKLRSGQKRDVSNGYACDLEMTAGVSPDGERYDAIQRAIVGNHVAIVDAGRAGSARVRMDGAAIQIPTSVAPSLDDKSQRADAHGRIFEMEELQKKLGEALAQLTIEKNRADKAEGERDTHKVRADKAEGERDTAKSRADTAEKARTDALAATPAMVKERVALVTKATIVLGAAHKLDGKDLIDCEPRALRCAVIAKVDGSEVPADKRENDAYIEGRFDAAYAVASKSTGAVDAAHAAIAAVTKTDAKPAVPNGDSEDPEKAARKKMHEDSRTEWKHSDASNGSK